MGVGIGIAAACNKIYTAVVSCWWKQIHQGERRGHIHTQPFQFPRPDQPIPNKACARRALGQEIWYGSRIQRI